MNKTLVLNQPFFGLIKKNYRKASGTLNFAYKGLVFFFIIVNFVLFASYIFGVNDYAATGYEIKSLQNKIDNIKQVNKKLNLEFSEKASATNLEKNLKNDGYIFTSNIKFLSVNRSLFSKK